MNYTNKKLMHTRFWSFSTRLTVSIIAVAVIAIVPFTVYYLNQTRTNTESHAAASTTLAFSQPALQVNAGSPITEDITMNPGSNAVSLVTLIIDYDSSAVTPSTTNGIVPNAQVFPQTLDGPTYNVCNGTLCTMTVSLSVGNDPTKAIKTTSTIATVNFTPVSQNGTTQIAFDNQTQVFSVASGDQANENVLSTTTPSTITIGQGSTISPTPFPQASPTPTPTSAASSPTPSATEGVTPTVVCIGSPCCNGVCPSMTPATSPQPNPSETPVTVSESPTPTPGGGGTLLSCDFWKKILPKVTSCTCKQILADLRICFPSNGGTGGGGGGKVTPTPPKHITPADKENDHDKDNNKKGSGNGNGNRNSAQAQLISLIQKLINLLKQL